MKILDSPEWNLKYFQLFHRSALLSIQFFDCFYVNFAIILLSLHAMWATLSTDIFSWSNPWYFPWKPYSSLCILMCNICRIYASGYLFAVCILMCNTSVRYLDHFEHNRRWKKNFIFNFYSDSEDSCSIFCDLMADKRLVIIFSEQI